MMTNLKRVVAASLKKTQLVCVENVVGKASS